MEFEDEAKPLHSVHCSPAPGTERSSPARQRILVRSDLCEPLNCCFKFPSGPFRPCLHLLGSWLIRGGVWLIAALSLVSNSLVVLSVFFSRTPSLTPPKLLIGLLALANGLMGVWSGWLAAVDAWTFGNFWRYETQLWASGRIIVKCRDPGERSGPKSGTLVTVGFVRTFDCVSCGNTGRLGLGSGSCRDFL